jgi:hypothetical protein
VSLHSQTSTLGVLPDRDRDGICAVDRSVIGIVAVVAAALNSSIAENIAYRFCDGIAASF